MSGLGDALGKLRVGDGIAWLFKPEQRPIAEIDRLGRPHFWERRQRMRSRRIRRSIRSQRLRATVRDSRTDLRIVLTFARQAIAPAISGLALIAVAELVAWSLSRAGWHFVGRVDVRLKPSSYEVLVGAVVTAQATFLALYYTTVGVVASTAYQSVPGEIRQLFVEERSGVVYARGVVRALVFGVIVLLANAVGYRPYALTVVLLAGVTLLTVFRLMVMGRELFRFFDPSALTGSLPDRISTAVRRASQAGTAHDEGSQATAHHDAATTLRLYRRIAILLAQRSTHDPEAARAIGQQLIRITAVYGAAKNAIPSDSRWWSRTPVHPNWLALDHTRLSIAMATSTGVAPELRPDPLWVEKEVATIFSELLRGLSIDAELSATVILVDAAMPLLKSMGARLLVDEALILQKELGAALVAGGSAAVRDPHSTDELTPLAAAERSILMLTDIWIGFALAARAISAERASTIFDEAILAPEKLYESGLPRSTVSLLEDIGRKVRAEPSVEGRRVTPPWWVHHYGARVLAQQLRDSHDAIIAAVEPGTLQPIEQAVTEGRVESAATMIFTTLELLNKVESHQPGLVAAFEALGQLRNTNTGDTRWPEPVDDHGWVKKLRQAVLAQLAGCTSKLRTMSHDPSRPDLYGQAYQFVFDATFDALIGGDTELGRTLFPIIFTESDSVRNRLASDLSEQAINTRLVYGFEPLVGLMELSGYALLLTELDGGGVWELAKQLWDAAIEGNPKLPELLVGVVSSVNSVFGLSAPAIARTSRRQALAQVLRERGVVSRRDDYPFSRRRARPHPSPIVSAVAPGDLGLHDDLSDLFIAEYVRPHLGRDVELPVRVASLARSIDKYREEKVDAPTPEGVGDLTADNGVLHDIGPIEQEQDADRAEMGVQESGRIDERDDVTEDQLETKEQTRQDDDRT